MTKQTRQGEVVQLNVSQLLGLLPKLCFCTDQKRISLI